MLSRLFDRIRGRTHGDQGPTAAATGAIAAGAAGSDLEEHDAGASSSAGRHDTGSAGEGGSAGDAGGGFDASGSSSGGT